MKQILAILMIALTVMYGAHAGACSCMSLAEPASCCSSESNDTDDCDGCACAHAPTERLSHPFAILNHSQEAVLMASPDSAESNGPMISPATAFLAQPAMSPPALHQRLAELQVWRN